jgi:hypothetical protein
MNTNKSMNAISVIQRCLDSLYGFLELIDRQKQNNDVSGSEELEFQELPIYALFLNGYKREDNLTLNELCEMLPDFLQSRRQDPSVGAVTIAVKSRFAKVHIHFKLFYKISDEWMQFELCDLNESLKDWRQ